MAAVVRIKRRLDEDPLETLVLNCKRRKTNADDHTGDDNLSAVLKLAGTSQKGENIESLLRRQKPEDITELKEQFKKHTVNINEKLRSEIRESSKNSRYRVVNCFRKTLNSEENNENLAASTSTSEVTVLDIETDHSTEEATPSKGNSDDPSKYVYDFYYTSSDDFGQANIEEYVSLYPLHDPLVFGSVRDNGLNDEDSEYDSEDSNAENNWKNDYPDEEILNSGDEDDLMLAVNKLNLEELSSDSGEEDLVYGADEEDFQHEVQDVDREDELRYGKMYAKFKAKNKNVVTTGLANDFYVGDIDEDEYYY